MNNRYFIPISIIILLLIGLDIATLNVSANYGPIIDRGNPKLSLIATFLANLPINFFVFIWLFMKIKKNRTLRIEPYRFLQKIILMIFILSIFGSFIDFYLLPFKPGMDYRDNVNLCYFGNLPAAFIIFLTYFLLITLYLKQKWKYALTLSVIIGCANYLAWLFIFTRLPNMISLCCVGMMISYPVSLTGGFYFHRWYTRKYKCGRT